MLIVLHLVTPIFQKNLNLNLAKLALSAKDLMKLLVSHSLAAKRVSSARKVE